MRSELHRPEELFHKMKKKPALQAILDNMDDYTVEQLETVHGQPLWIRKILVKMKSGTTDEDSMANAMMIANMMDNDTGERIYPKCEVRNWIGGDWLMPCGRTGSMTIEIHYGDKFFVVDSVQHAVTISSAYSVLNNQLWQYFLNNTQVVGTMTKSEYANMISQGLGRNFVDREAIAKQAGPNSYVPSSNGELFQIIRHEVK